MKKLLYAFLVLALLLPSSFAFAASGAPGAWVSSINIQNPSAVAADVTLLFYDATGALKLTFPVTPSIPAGGSRSLYLPTDVTALASGQFSVIAQSTTEVNIVVNSSSSVPYTAGAYSGLQPTDIGTTLYFPGLYNNYYGFYSELVVQNTSTSVANISVQFYNQKTGAAVGSPYTQAVPASASAVLTLNTLSNPQVLPSGNTTGLYSAKVTSNVAVGGIANIWTSAKYGEFSDYNAFVSGATTAVVPALYKYYYGFVSSLTVQNISASPVDITVTYSGGQTDTAAAVQPNQAVEFFQPNNATLPSGNTTGVFSAKITATGNVVALVNVEDKTKGSLASYNGAKTPTATVLCPVVLKAFYKWFSAETIQNVGTLTTDITVTYASGQVRTFTSVPPNGTVNVIELAAAGSVLPDLSSVSATITSSNAQPLVAVVQENSNELYSSNPGDYLLAYTCSNK